MFFFYVIIHGDGIEIASADAPPIVGFYTTRAVAAKSERAAVDAALAAELKEWISGAMARHNSGALPRLELDAVWRIGVFRYLWRRPKGYTFYPDDD